MPQAGKQLLGAGRQFVSGEESRQRLPELALFAGAVLMYEAAGQPAFGSGQVVMAQTGAAIPSA